VTPRPYQSRTLSDARGCFAAGKRAVLIVSPTGSGKTCIAAWIARGHVDKSPRNRVVWLAHRGELLDQAAGALHGVDLCVGLRGVNAYAAVQCCSIQALTRRREAPEGTLIIADEAHHLAEGNGWTDLTRTYLTAGARIVGLTATPARADDQALHGFDALVLAAQIGELQALGHLVPLRLKRPTSFLRPDRIAQKPVDAFYEHANARSTVVFAPHVKAAEQYVYEFRGLGVSCEMVTGKTPADKRARMLGHFNTGDIRVLVNVGVLTEGWDSPICSCIILARGCGSQALYMQMTGRALRPYAGKSDALLIDLRGVSWLLGRPDQDRDYSLEGKGIILRGASATERMCPVCGLPLGDAATCPECGRETEQVIPQATGEKLVDWDEQAHEAVKDQLKPNRAVLSLAGMMRKYGERRAINMFRGIFKRHPDARTVAQAHAFNHAKDGAIAPFAVDEMGDTTDGGSECTRQ